MNIKPFFYLIMVLGIFSCSNDDDTLGSEECIPTPKSSFSNEICQDDIDPNDFLCEYSYFGSYLLSERSKNFLRHYCEPTGSFLRYVNSEGDVMTFDVKRRRNRIQRLRYSTGLPCEIDSMKQKGRCIHRQATSYNLVSRDGSIELTIEAGSVPEASQTSVQGDGIGDILEILRKTDSSLSIDFRVIINQGTFVGDKYQDQENYDSLSFNGKMFNNVISSDVRFRTDFVFKYYVNEENGLFALEDREGEVWVLEN